MQIESFKKYSWNAACLGAMLLIAHVSPAMSAGSTPCELHRTRFLASTNGADKAKSSVDVIESCGLGKYQSLSNFDAAFGTSFFQGRVKNMPRGTHNTVVLYFEPQNGSKNDATAAASTGWYLAIKYDGRGTVLDYHISNSSE